MHFIYVFIEIPPELATNLNNFLCNFWAHNFIVPMVVEEKKYPSFDLSGKTALITGAARGIGRSCALALAHMQRSGHRPIAVVGGGTTLVGDPGGKTETRPIISREKIDENAQGIKRQLSCFLDFSN